MLYPSDYISSVDEYLPGLGVYSSKDSLRSSNIGELEVDKSKHIARLKIVTKIPRMQGVGTITLGIVAQIKDSFAIVDLVPFESRSFNLIPRGVTTILDISELKHAYVKNMRECIRIGDIIRAKIIEVEPDTVRISIAEKNLGVVQAYCSECRKELKGQGRMFICDNCGTKQFRKTSFDYGSGNVI